MSKERIVYPYIPNTAPVNNDAMKKVIGIKDEMELYADIPDALKFTGDLDIPEPYLDEFSIKQHVKELLKKNVNAEDYDCYLGVGCAKHYTPAVCDEMMGRGEFVTAYYGSTTCDRGKWQAIWEYQAQMSELLDVDYVGFPQYDGSSSLGHAMLMSVRMTGRKKILIPATLNPQNYLVALDYTNGVGDRQADLVKVKADPATGLMDMDDLKAKLDDTVAAIVVENPTFLGGIETNAVEIGRLAKNFGAEYIVYTDPIALGVMAPPAQYGATISCGDIHSLGGHLAAGGCQGGFVGVSDDPRYLGNVKDQAVSVAPTVKDGEYVFVLYNHNSCSYELKEKANEYTGTTSNLWAINAAVYLSLMGPKGMAEVGETIMKRSQYAAKALASVPGAKLQFSGPFFQEFVVNFDESGKTVAEINKKLLGYKIIGGYDISSAFPEYGQSAVYCVTEVNTKTEIDKLAAALREILA